MGKSLNFKPGDIRPVKSPHGIAVKNDRLRMSKTRQDSHLNVVNSFSRLQERIKGISAGASGYSFTLGI